MLLHLDTPLNMTELLTETEVFATANQWEIYFIKHYFSLNQPSGKTLTGKQFLLKHREAL